MSIAGYFCTDAFTEVSSVPVVDLLDVVELEVKRGGFKRIGLLGTFGHGNTLLWCSQ